MPNAAPNFHVSLFADDREEFGASCQLNLAERSGKFP
jgi:hypothetical protein